MPAGPPVYTGNHTDLKVYHPVDDEDGDVIGPKDWDLISTATFQTAKATFGKALLCDATNEALRSGVDIGALDESDTGKTIFFCYWEPDDISFVRNQIFITSVSFAPERARLAFDTASGGIILMRWVRKTDISPGLNTIDVKSNSGKISIDTPFTIAGYINHGSSGEGKIFINGIDETASITEVARPANAGINKRVIFGNSQTGLAPARIVDEPCIIQGTNLSDSKLADLLAQGSDTRALGYHPVLTSIDPSLVGIGQQFSVIGQGFAKDVTMKIDDINVSDLVRTDEGNLSGTVPDGVTTGEKDIEITNVEAGVTLSISNAFNVEAPDDEQLRLILRGERNGTAHPICEFKVIDDAGDEVILVGEVKRKEVVLRRDDRRTALARFVPPVQSLDVTLKNDQKQFTRGFGGAFDGLLVQGQVVIPRMGFLVDGIRDLREFGKFRIDDVEFNNSPPAEARIQCRDLLSAALDQDISIRSFNGTASAYIIEILSKVGIITEGSEKEIDIPTTTTTFSTPTITKTRALDILSEVLAALQAEANYRLIQDIDGIIKLVIVPSSGFSDQSFHWLKDLAAPYTQKERANQSSLRTTIVKSDPPSVTEDASLFSGSLTEADFTGSPKKKTITFSKAIRIIVRTPEDLAQDFKVIEVARTPTSVILEMENPSDTGTINVLIRGDTTSDVVGESGSGKDQGGVGFGNEINRQKRRRGRTREIQVRFIANDSEAQAVSDIIQIRFGDPASEQDFGVTFAPIRTKLNDLVRIIEKFSESRDLQSVSQITLIFEAGDMPGSGDSFTGNLIVLDAGIQEPIPNYDLGFIYDRGLIYDDRFKIGDVASQDLSFRGAVVVDL